MSCGCGGLRPAGGTGDEELVVLTERPLLPAFTPNPLGGLGLPSATGSMWIDAGIGAAAGALVAARSEDRLLWSAIGGVAGLLGGAVGIVGTVGVAFYLRSKRET